MDRKNHNVTIVHLKPAHLFPEKVGIEIPSVVPSPDVVTRYGRFSRTAFRSKPANKIECFREEIGTCIRSELFPGAESDEAFRVQNKRSPLIPVTLAEHRR
ncbi:hypothetical protein NPIL_92601 [Nephila pilipes]|uniref:Uncharacterized protein n=1 Tax=Nephila pilipes TaxID=299642 RepID=A0A8X6P9U7_NEPPI|nr:hypothetical protein NPIL_92601 [Nephila pilipes]